MYDMHEYYHLIICNIITMHYGFECVESVFMVINNPSVWKHERTGL